MRKLSVLVILAALALAPQAALSAKMDGHGGKMQMPGGFSGPISGVMADTVEKAAQQENDAPVILTGNIISQIAGKKDRFLFRDATGEIRVDIDKKAFRGQTVTPQDTVRLFGKVDKDFGEQLEIDVKRLEIVNP